MNLYPQLKRNTLIDSFRGMSILAVILLHINLVIPFNQYHLAYIIPQSVFNIIFRSGYYGVMIFFVISGFLITNSLLNKWGSLVKIETGQFYRMRFARIIPCLLGVLIILSILDIANIKGFIITTTTLGHALFAALTFHVNWLEAKTGYLPANWNVLWSLSVEEIFYIFFPLACLLIRKESIIKLMLILFVILGPFARNYFYVDNDMWSDHSYLSCMDGIAIGCLAALYSDKLNAHARSLLFMGLIFFSLVFFFRHFVSLMGLTKIGLNVTMLEVGIACILIGAQNKSIQVKYLSYPLSWFGKNSYEIYLTHMFVLMGAAYVFYALKIPLAMTPFYYLMIIISSGIIGSLIAKRFSEPLNKLLRTKQNPAFTQAVHEVTAS